MQPTTSGECVFQVIKPLSLLLMWSWMDYRTLCRDLSGRVWGRRRRKSLAWIWMRGKGLVASSGWFVRSDFRIRACSADPPIKDYGCSTLSHVHPRRGVQGNARPRRSHGSITRVCFVHCSGFWIEAIFSPRVSNNSSVDAGCLVLVALAA